jgi:hypothetical protein
MAEVDFSNARIEPWNGVPSLGSTLDSWTKVNPTWKGYITLYSSRDILAAGATIISQVTVTKTTDQQKRVVFNYQGTFNASGTEFMYGYAENGEIAIWKISNISFQSGDTYNFNIRADLICQ